MSGREAETSARGRVGRTSRRGLGVAGVSVGSAAAGRCTQPGADRERCGRSVDVRKAASRPPSAPTERTAADADHRHRGAHAVAPAVSLAVGGGPTTDGCGAADRMEGDGRPPGGRRREFGSASAIKLRRRWVYTANLAPGAWKGGMSRRIGVRGSSSRRFSAAGWYPDTPRMRHYADGSDAQAPATW